jgi:AraC-like DNA-binding protein
VITTSLISHIDFFIRYACIGQLILLIAFLFYKSHREHSRLFAQTAPFLLALGFIAYLLLTAPFSPRPQGFIRSVLLMFTHTMPVFLWLFGKQLFDDDFDLKRWPLWGKSLLVVLAFFYLYTFLVRGGGGQMQMLSHVIALLFILHLLASVVFTWRNDLVEQRRVARFWLVLLVSVFFLMLDLVELSNTRLNRHQLFMLMNASICLIGTSVTAAILFIYESSRPTTAAEQATRSIVDTGRYSRLIPQENALYEKLQAFIASGGYMQSDLTISQLATQLECPDHHLRKLINQRLGYTNFNAFLNHYRVEEACKRLGKSHLPVLSIALDLGYGSIASFNRAFKDKTATTPTAYRTAKQAQKFPPEFQN